MKTKYCLGCQTRKAYTNFPQVWRNAQQKFYARARCVDCFPAYQQAINRRSGKKGGQAIRLETLEYYSKGLMACACCGEGSIEFLALDHINGDGNKWRREMHAQGKTSSYDCFRWLKRNAWPTGYQVLCHNCNMAKGFYKYCPHREVAPSHTL